MCSNIVTSEKLSELSDTPGGDLSHRLQLRAVLGVLNTLPG